MKRSSRRWKKKGQMRWKWQRKKMKKEKIWNRTIFFHILLQSIMGIQAQENI
jgi:hypothetical protein